MCLYYFIHTIIRPQEKSVLVSISRGSGVICIGARSDASALWRVECKVHATFVRGLAKDFQWLGAMLLWAEDMSESWIGKLIKYIQLARQSRFVLSI